MQKVAAYCRVSTDKEDQINSLESQKKYFNEYINRNPLWVLTEVYVDEGVTGTNTRNRNAFHKMIADAEKQMFDLIITKEISRFARNTLDSIFYTRKLKDLGIGVIFMNDNINTLDSDSELRLTIMSSIAQEESRKTSERVKWGQKRRMEQGVVFGRDMLGYDVRDGKLIINERGAEVVHIIFHKYTNEGKGTHVIARELQDAGINSFTHSTKWSNVAILRILRNEKYVGDLIQKKSYTPNYLNHKKKSNLGEEDFVVIRDHHEPIINRELFERTQKEIIKRSPSKEIRAKHSNRYCFSGKIKCGLCGCSYVSRTRTRKNGTSYREWKCYKAVTQGKSHLNNQGNDTGCNSYTIKEETMIMLMQQVVNNLSIDNQKLVNNLLQLIDDVIDIEGSQKHSIKLKQRLIQVSIKRQGLVDMYLSKEINKEDYLTQYKKYNDEINRLKTELPIIILEKPQEFGLIKTSLAGKENKLNEITFFLEGLLNGTKWNDIFYHNIIDRIYVNDQNHLDVCLKALPETFSVSLNNKN